MSRVYLPATVGLLADWHGSGRVPPQAERVLAEAEDEESEYLALATAADLAGRMLERPGRRVVVVADAPDPEAEIDFADVVAVHADTTDLAPSAAVAQEDPDLAWFATQEVPALLH